MDSTPTSIFDADFDKSQVNIYFYKVPTIIRQTKDKINIPLILFQLPPIDQKRLVAFVNHFLIDTTEFLNSFLVNCENKFITLESKLQKINAELVIIESKIFQGELVSTMN